MGADYIYKIKLPLSVKILKLSNRLSLTKGPEQFEVKFDTKKKNNIKSLFSKLRTDLANLFTSVLIRTHLYASH